jgi:hypothetical protein
MPKSEPGEPSPADRCAAEINELHQFFEDWLTGTLSETDAAFERVERALGPRFRLIHPSGAWRSRDDILKGLRRGYGGQPDLTIRIRDVRLRETGESLLLATYEEWQEAGDSSDARLSTVLFRRAEEGPNGLRWVHVHETWMP